MSTAWIKIVAHNLAKEYPNSSENYRSIMSSPTSSVVRMLATGNENGKFHFYPLEGYNTYHIDDEIIREMLE